MRFSFENKQVSHAKSVSTDADMIDLVEVGTLSPDLGRIFEGKPTSGAHSQTCPIELKF